MRPALTLRLGQQQKLTPQLQQALRLLAMPAFELELELRTALDQNPMLETDEQVETLEVETPVDADWDSAELAESSNAPSSGERPDLEQVFELDLRGHLIDQLEECRFSEADLEIALALLDALDDHGWLATPVAELAAELGVESAELEAVRHRLQRLDPLGVASTGLGDCLAVQLSMFEPTTSGLACAKRLVAEHLAALAQPRIALLARLLSVAEDEIGVALALIRALHPRPADLLPTAEPEHVIPDAVVRKHAGRWLVELNTANLPRLRVNQGYATLLERGGDSPLRAQLTEARWLVRSLTMRNQTLLAVARALVERQVGFLDRGPEAMRPLLARELALQLELHESTISRVTAGKWLLTPRGCLPFRHFFSTQLERDDGGDTSATAVRALIERLVNEEDARRPLSDAELTRALVSRGIRVARRTVTKYREALAIPVSYERRALQ